MEKGLRTKVKELSDQLKRSQDTLKEREKDIQQVQTQLKTTQGSFSEEVKKLQSQMADMQTSQTKKVGAVRIHIHLMTWYNLSFVPWSFFQQWCQTTNLI